MLVKTVEAGFITQRFGPAAASVASREPEMWALPSSTKAYWQPFTGAVRFDHFHPGIDRGAPAGSPIRAMENGRVIFAGFNNMIDGNLVKVQINGEAGYSANHCGKIHVKVGQQVSQGDLLAEVGCTGSCTGAHAHESVYIADDSAGFIRTFLWNPELFLKGGSLQNSSLIKPLQQIVQVDGPGVNLRFAPLEFDGKGDVFARSLDDGAWGKKGIYRMGTGNRIGPINKQFDFIRWQDAEGGRWAIVRGFNRRLGIRSSQVVFV